MESPRFTDDQLCQEARKWGYAVSTRLIDDWVQAGLLDRPTRHGLGRGKGSEAWWPESQCQLFLALLKHRKQLKQIAPLCNIPVWLWLDAGDEIVPLQQVRRAMHTWASAVQQLSLDRNRSAAKKVVMLLADPKAPPKHVRQLQVALTTWVYDKRRDRDSLLRLVRPVFVSDQASPARSPAGAIIRADDYVDLVFARYRVMIGIDAIEDDQFRQARQMYRAVLAGYTNQQLRLAADPELGGMFTNLSLDDVVNGACFTLATCIGLHLPQDWTPPSKSDSLKRRARTSHRS